MRPEGHVLFIDWDGVNREALKTALEEEGFQVACSPNERDALDRLRRGQRPDLALLDLTPAAEGAAEFIRALKQDPTSASLPVIVFSPAKGTSFLEADAFLKKPVDLDDLLATVRRYCLSTRVVTRSPDRATQPDRGRKVLIVDDNRDGADSLAMLLELLGHEVRVAYNGLDGVREARAWRPEVVLCDIGLPGLDGFGVAGELRRDGATAGARLIAVTAYAGEDTRRCAHESGFDLVLTKPADPSVLLQLVNRPAQPSGRDGDGPSGEAGRLENT
jgi:CheY-like chemotaxis protein